MGEGNAGMPNYEWRIKVLMGLWVYGEEFAAKYAEGETEGLSDLARERLRRDEGSEGLGDGVT